jgi:hypothetical protein
VGERNHAPNVAIAIVLIIGAAFCYLTSFVNLSNIVALQSLFFALILLAGGVAATFLASRRPELILGETSGSEAERQAFLRKVTIVGALTTLLALFTVFEIVSHTSVYGKFSVESIITLVVVLGAGPVIYLIARAIRRQRNSIDLSLAMHELPPE